MKAKRPYHHGDLRAALMTAALSLIDQHGVKGLALSDAAHLAGVSVAAPYRHFKDKEALLAEIAAEGFTLFRDALARAAQSHPEDKVKRLVEMGVAYVDFALHHRSHFKVSSPCFQSAGVATLCFAVNCIESITRSSSAKLRPVLMG